MTQRIAAPARSTVAVATALVVVWFAGVVIAAETGVLAAIAPSLIGAIVAATIVAPTLAYFVLPRPRLLAEAIGHRRIVAFHVWRMPAALLFFWYGAQGALPPAFWLLAGVGDFIAGAFAAYLMIQPEDDRRYRWFHGFGFADFVVAVGTGLTFTVLGDPRMAPVASLPLALIVFFGVGLSGASHLIAFDMLRRRVGFATTGRPVVPAIA